MTRLITEWISDIEETIHSKEAQLKAKTGLDYAALAARASGCSAQDIARAAQAVKIGVVPITSGQGVIGSFSQSVASIVGAMGFQSFVTEKSDVDGIYEAYRCGADLLYIADDDRFLAMNLHKNKVADNNAATAAGYVAALEGLAGTLAGKEVLLLGYGVLGKEFLKRLKNKGAAVSVHEIDPDKLSALSKEGVPVVSQREDIARYNLIVDATNEGGWLHEDVLHPEVRIAAPGVPLSLDEKTYEKFSGRVVQDCLEIGVAAMLGLAL